MRGYLFDSMVHVAAQESLPNKWRRHWKEATVGRRILILLERQIVIDVRVFSSKPGRLGAKDGTGF